ncbi:MAG TPA: hypothetical protein VGF20_03140 [Candidatus Acidoferrum sp.]|jgi:hypothetical protein
MKRFALFLVLGGMLSAPSVFAQDHVAVGAYFDYFRLSQTDTDFAGLGGRLGVGLGHHVMLEAEMSYDFNKVFDENFDNLGSVTVNRSNIRLLHGLFGPKVSLGHSNFHPFITIKGGFLNSRFDSIPANLSSFVSSVQNLRDDNVMGTLYPGGGLEGHVGPIGLRLDVGDEMYFNHGTHNNLRAAFGPYIRF